MTTLKRGNYSEILEWPEFAMQLRKQAEEAGCWTSGIKNTGRRGKYFDAVNVDLFGFDESKQLAVVQVRRCESHKYGLTIHKNWFLLGYVESGNVFAHSIDSPIRSRRAKEDPAFCVAFVESRIWQCDVSEVDDIIRQGDVALIPIRKMPDSVVETEQTIIVRDSHKINGRIYRDTEGTLYCRGAVKMVHTRNQHGKVSTKAGLYRIQPGMRAALWDFSTPTVD